jgi:hypothetical protein
MEDATNWKEDRSLMLAKSFFVLSLMLCATLTALAQEDSYDGLDNNLSNLYRVSRAKTFSISPENLTGEKGKGGMAKQGNASDAARELGQGWKVNPFIIIEPGKTFTLAEITGQGAIQHIWMTPTGNWRFSIIRMYWDDEATPSVETPAGDFFAMGWGKYAQISSLAICVNPGSAFNSYWVMPFRKKARITMENLDGTPMRLYYQIDYTLTQKEVYTIIDNIKGKGHYVGTYLAWGVNSNGWWGEGEIKFYMDGDQQFPTICGTGTEDYFCGSYNFENQEKKQYQEFTTPYSGLAQVIRPDGLYQSQQRFGLYRWHIADPVRFESDLRVTIQALGWKSAGRYLPLRDDIASVAYWYQVEPHAPFPKLPNKDQLEVN